MQWNHFKIEQMIQKNKWIYKMHWIKWNNTIKNYIGYFKLDLIFKN